VRQRARRDAERRASAAGSGSGTVAGPGQAAGPAARADEPGEIVVRRPRGYHYAVFRRYRILIDGRAAGTVARGAELRTAVAPGSHTVVARIDWTGSPEVTVDVPPGRRVVLEVEPAEDPIAGMFSTDRALTLSVRP
jgi:hypothetical protein